MNSHEVVQVLKSTRVRYCWQNLLFVWTTPLFPPACEQRPFLTRFNLSFLFRSLTGGSNSWSQSRGAAQQNNRLLSPLLFHSLSHSFSLFRISLIPRSLWHSYLLLSSFFLSLSLLVCFVWCCHCGIKVLRLIIVCLFGTQQHLVWF